MIQPTPRVETADKACQCPDNIIVKENTDASQEELIEAELALLLRFLSKNISLLKDSTFDDFARENLKNLSSLHRDLSHKDHNLPALIKRRYIQVNKTKEEMTKFIIRRCFLFIKTKINYQDKEGLPAEERDRLFYQTFFQEDPDFMNLLKLQNQSVDDLIPFRKDSKMKTMNDAYLKSLFQSRLFSQFYHKFLEQFKEICIHENADKIENMTKQMIRIIYSHDFAKIKNYRRFPWKDHEIVKCEERAKELARKYADASKKNLKAQSKQLELLEKKSDLSDKTSESVYPMMA